VAFVVAAQNHDQIGNRATGERLSHLASPGRLKIAAALLLSAPFVPMLFQGEEWGASSPFQYFTSHEDPELGAQVSEGRRKEFAAFGWDPFGVPDPQAPETFERSRLHWDELAVSEHAELLEWHRALLAHRRGCSDLRNGNYDNTVVTFSEAKRQLVIRRGVIVVVCNLGDDQLSLDVPHALRLLLASEPGVCVRNANITVPADAIAFVELVSSADVK
jgi:maltooligosyltrehalose trehalohydrolase